MQAPWKKKIGPMPERTIPLLDYHLPGRTILERGRLAVLSPSQDGLVSDGTTASLSRRCDMPPAKPRWQANNRRWNWTSQQSAGLRPR
eukprot:256848-Pyramimonas_sp.AAC.1